MIKAIIFDLDGVLIDATEWHYEALNNALGLFGYAIGREDHIKVYNGLPTNNKLSIMSERQGLPVGLHEPIKAMKRKYTDEIVAQKCRPNHTKQLMLAHLKIRGYKLACASNAQKYSVLNMLKMPQIDHFFEHIIGNDEGFSPKPAPDIYLAAFDRMGIIPQEAIIVEDAPHGIEAAKASGAHVITVRGFEDVNLSLFSDSDLLNGTKTETERKDLDKYSLENMARGWFIGNFEPSLLKTDDFEVAVMRYNKGDKDRPHYHKIATEYTVIVSGLFKLNGNLIKQNDIVILRPGELSEFECLSDGVTVVVKAPSAKDDKFCIDENI